MIIDVHCHYTLSATRRSDLERFSFEPLHDLPAAGDPTPPSAYDSCVSPRVLRRGTWRLARRLLKLPRPGAALDCALAERYARHLLAPGPIDRYVLLAFDAVHSDDGELVPLPRPGDQFGSDIYTSNTFIRELCRQHPQRFLFGASVHPYRSDAVECVEEVFAAGACLLKWLPVHHNIDVRDARSIGVLRCCARLGSAGAGALCGRVHAHHAATSLSGIGAAAGDAA